MLADGTFDYSRITEYLLKPEQYDLEGLFRDSFLRYYQQSGQGQSSTVTLVRSDAMEGLAEVCATLAAKYRTALAGLNYRRVQGFYRLSRHYFFDLEDIFVQCGATESDLTRLRQAVDRCIVYRNATPYFLNMDCGYQMKQELRDISFTMHLLDSIVINDPKIGIYGTENLSLYY